MQSIEPIQGEGVPAAMKKTHAVGDSGDGGWITSVCGKVRRNSSVPVRVTKGVYRAPIFGHFDPSVEDACPECMEKLREEGILRKLATQAEKFSTPQIGPNGKPFLSFWVRRAQ